MLISCTRRASRLGSIFCLLASHGAVIKASKQTAAGPRSPQRSARRVARQRGATVGIPFELVGARGLHEAVETGPGLGTLDDIGEEMILTPEYHLCVILAISGMKSSSTTVATQIFGRTVRRQYIERHTGGPVVHVEVASGVATVVIARNLDPVARAANTSSPSLRDAGGFATPK